MSWYNNEDNSFIDATQTFEGGSGNISGGDGNGTGAGSQLSDVLELKLDYFENEYEVANTRGGLKVGSDIIGKGPGYEKNLYFFHSWHSTTCEKYSARFFYHGIHPGHLIISLLFSGAYEPGY